MAEVHVLEPETDVRDAILAEEIEENSEAEPRKRGRGRPKKEKPVAAVEQDFFEMLASWPDTTWQYTVAHLYRTGPVLDTTRGGKDKSFIKKFNSPFDQETVKHECGSGGYAVHVNIKPPNGQNEHFGPYYFEVYDPEYAPAVPRGDWMKDPKNSKWAALMPAEEKPQAAPQVHVQAAPQIDPLKLITTVFDTAEKMNRKQEPVKAEAETKNVDPTLMILIESLREDRRQAQEERRIAEERAREERKRAEDEARESRKEMAQLQQQNFQIILKTLEAKTAQPVQSGIESIKGLVEVAGLLREFGGGGSGASGLTGEIVNGVKELITPWSSSFAPVVGQLALQSAQKKHAEDMAKLQQQQQQGGGVARVPNQPVQQQPNQPEQQHQEMQQQPASQPGMETVSDVPQGLMVIVDFFAGALQINLDGDVAAEQFEKKFGELQYDQMIQTPKDQIIPMLKAFPSVWNVLAPYEEKLPKFIDGFYSYNDEPPQEEAEPEPEPAATSKPAKKPRKVVQ